jgi:hypothetical protein
MGEIIPLGTTLYLAEDIILFIASKLHTHYVPVNAGKWQGS